MDDELRLPPASRLATARRKKKDSKGRRLSHLAPRTPPPSRTFARSPQRCPPCRKMDLARAAACVNTNSSARACIITAAGRRSLSGVRSAWSRCAVPLLSDQANPALLPCLGRPRSLVGALFLMALGARRGPWRFHEASRDALITAGRAEIDLEDARGDGSWASRRGFRAGAGAAAANRKGTYPFRLVDFRGDAPNLWDAEASLRGRVASAPKKNSPTVRPLRAFLSHESAALLDTQSCRISSVA